MSYTVEVESSYESSEAGAIVMSCYRIVTMSALLCMIDRSAGDSLNCGKEKVLELSRDQQLISSLVLTRQTMYFIRLIGTIDSSVTTI